MIVQGKIDTSFPTAQQTIERIKQMRAERLQKNLQGLAQRMERAMVYPVQQQVNDKEDAIALKQHLEHLGYVVTFKEGTGQHDEEVFTVTVNLPSAAQVESASKRTDMFHT